MIKINKWGARQERLMGIDRDQITNSLPTKNAVTFLGMQKTTAHVRGHICATEPFAGYFIRLSFPGESKDFTGKPGGETG